MKVLSANQIRKADKFTIENHPIKSIDLMERAARGIMDYISRYIERETSFNILCGNGNNGGDGLALARLLKRKGYKLKVFVIGNEEGRRGSKDFQENLARLKQIGGKINQVQDIADLIDFQPNVIIIDAILGSGLNRPLEGLIKEIVVKINQLPNPVIAIDIPSGLFADDNTQNDLNLVMKADITLSFQSPKLSFFHRDTASLANKFSIIEIGLDQAFINGLTTKNFYFSKPQAKQLFRPRKDFSYKGTYGHALILAGGEGKYGAALLASKSCMRTGTGLLSVCIPREGTAALHSFLPEAMAIESGDKYVVELPNLAPYTAIGIGPGIGQKLETARVLKKIIQVTAIPLVFDADALNILSENKTWLSFLPAQTVLTPHIGEFKRLIGVNKINSNYLEQLRDFSSKHNVITVLKDSITTVATPNGLLYFVKEGNAALATAGSGDVLTGAILGLLSSGYTPIEAALFGVYLHGRAGTIVGESFSLESVLATDVISSMGRAFKELY